MRYGPISRPASSAGPMGRVRRRRQDRHRGALRERSRRLVGGEQRLDVGAEPAVVPARLLDERRPRLGWLLQRRVEDRLDAGPAVALVRDRHAPRPSVRRRIQPGPRRAPFAGDRGARQRQHRRDLVFRQPAEVLQLDDPCLALVELRQRSQVRRRASAARTRSAGRRAGARRASRARRRDASRRRARGRDRPGSAASCARSRRRTGRGCATSSAAAPSGAGRLR